METILHETSYLKISYFEDIKALNIVWQGFTSSEEFRAGIDLIFHFMAEKKAKKTITDISEHKVIGSDDQEYAARLSVDFTRQYWNVKRAIITPKDVFTRFSIKQVNSQVAKQEQQERRFFANFEEAKEWLQED